ncbi:hypothetical protein AGLY_008560 [Aphis glycines]|uniref:Uncharacterized protein n=1 Tax=Aphis glycines TaxID=307491 RepID=A0A6G0TKY3_APHGL|nr:hypothetical protein AGLY_008560 [Aphis glycines]
MIHTMFLYFNQNYTHQDCWLLISTKTRNASGLRLNSDGLLIVLIAFEYLIEFLIAKFIALKYTNLAGLSVYNFEVNVFSTLLNILSFSSFNLKIGTLPKSLIQLSVFTAQTFVTTLLYSRSLSLKRKSNIIMHYLHCLSIYFTITYEYLQSIFTALKGEDFFFLYCSLKQPQSLCQCLSQVGSWEIIDNCVSRSQHGNHCATLAPKNEDGHKNKKMHIHVISIHSSLRSESKIKTD